MRTQSIKLNWVKIAAVAFGFALAICGFLVPVRSGLIDIGAGAAVILIALVWRPPRVNWRRIRFRAGSIFRSSDAGRGSWLR